MHLESGTSYVIILGELIKLLFKSFFHVLWHR